MSYISPNQRENEKEAIRREFKLMAMNGSPGFDWFSVLGSRVLPLIYFKGEFNTLDYIGVSVLTISGLISWKNNQMRLWLILLGLVSGIGYVNINTK